MSELDLRRSGRITGSRVAAILGLSPWQTRADVLRDMVRQANGLPSDFQGNVATRWGEAHEAEAIAMYETTHGVMTHGGQELVIHPDHDFLAVTPDGLVGHTGMIEVKCPYRADYDTIPDHYVPQVQLQLAVTGRAWCDFVIWRDGGIKVQCIEADPEWLPSVLPALYDFMTDYRAALADPAVYLESLERTDAEWRAAASTYLAAAEALAAAKAAADAAKDALIDLAPEGGKGCGVTLSKAVRKGSVQYAKALKDLAPDADLSAYMGAESTYYTVRT